ncbi:MAG: hypothetical protein GX590_12185 [Lentisphaerae bacterium]|nr:hypothetical protein [Lentisphaerota bacterium]
MSGGYFTTGSGLGVNMAAGRLSQCILTNNVNRLAGKGTGLYMSGGLAENCLIAHNRMAGDGDGGGVYITGGTLRNSTIVNNLSGRGGLYASGGVVENCIVRGNTVQASHSEIFSGANAFFVNCHLPPLLADNSGVFRNCLITNTAPNFRDAANGDFRLALGSPCIDAGRPGAAVAGARGADGLERVIGARVDIGAYEFAAGEGLTCGIDAPVMEAVGTLDVTLVAAVAGAAPEGALAYAWTTNGVAAGTSATLPLALATPGYYTVGLTVNDGTDTAQVVRTNLLYVVPPVLHVAAGHAGSRFPYATPATAAATIQAAIDAARDGSRILVGPGDYLLSQSLEVSKGIEIRSTDGPAATRVSRLNGVGTIRLMFLAHAQACIAGINFDNGYQNVINIWANGGVVSNCIIQRGTYTVGNGVGVRARSGLITHCLVQANACSGNEAGVGLYLDGDARAQNCLIRDNRSTAADTKGGVYLAGGAVIRNCTIVGNRATNGGGVYTGIGGLVENCIIYGNTISGVPGAGDPDWYTGGTEAVYRNTCTPVAIGSDCVTTLPLFLDADAGDYRISPASDCVDAGRAHESLVGAGDYFGNPRVSGAAVDIGCHEVVVAGASCDIQADALSVLEGQTITLTAVAVGFPSEAELDYVWDFDADGVPDATGRVVTHAFPRGRTTVKLTVTDGTTTAAIEKADLLMVAPLVLYVLPVNAASAYPYDSWEKAATNIQDAIDAALDGSLVWVGDGHYPISTRINLMKGVTLRSVSGRPDTVHVVQAGGVAGGRVVYVAHDRAVLQGMTLRDGTGGVLMDRAGGTLVDMVISNNTFGAGGGTGAGLLIYAGNVRRCVIADNRMTGSSDTAGVAIAARVGPEDPPVVLENCLIANNRSTTTLTTIGGLNALGGTVRNCTIVGNVASNAASAGGMYASAAAVIENCIITGNVNLQAPDKADWDGVAASFSHVCTAPDPDGTATFAADPRFVDPAAGDFRLLAGSPCINVGLTRETMAGETDLGGGRRVWQRRVDLGALEYVPPAGSLMVVR